MIVYVRARARADSLVVEEVNDLDRLKVVMDAPDLGAASRAISPAGWLESPEVAWLEVRAVRALASHTDPSWRSRFEAMVEKAAAHGWLSPDGVTVRAHCEWLGRPEEL